MIFSNISKMSDREEFGEEPWNFYEVNSKSEDVSGHIEVLRKNQRKKLQ